MKRVPNTKPLEVTFTGMITSSMEGRHIDDCISIFENMKTQCSPNIGTINAMLKVFGRSDMFFTAKELFEEIKTVKPDSDPLLDGGGTSLAPDEYTYISMLKASAGALQWEYFEHVYKEMALSGYQIDQSKHASLLVEASRAGKVKYTANGLYFFVFLHRSLLFFLQCPVIVFIFPLNAPCLE